jgi:transposase-like protein
MVAAVVNRGISMPYKSEKIPLGEKQDRRRKLTQEQKDEIVALYSTGLNSLRSLGRQFGVDKSYISILVNPGRAETVKNRIKKHWQDYRATKEDRAKIMQEHRQYKHSLYLKGELKMDKQIKVELDREDWVVLGKFLSKNVGKMVDIMPVMNLLQAHLKAGVSMKELEETK